LTAQAAGEEKKRLIQEYVPGKQVTLAHLIANPEKDLCESLGVEGVGAVGVMTITPGEGAIIAGDIASKAASVKIEFVDRFTGCLMMTGSVAEVETALLQAVAGLERILEFFPCRVTKT
jgi:ethanolamine utilization protein EutS